MTKKKDSGKGGTTIAAVERLAAPVAEAQGVSLWDIVFEKEGADWVLRIILDRAEGIDLDACEQFSRAIDPLLDEADPIDQSYSLEVSSPGLNRQLTRPWHFEKYVGAPVLVHTIRPVEGQRDFQGVLASYTDRAFTLTRGDAAPLSFRLAEVASVRLDDFEGLSL